MTEAHSHSGFIGRRAELIAQLFLEELEPLFLARPEQDLAYDFLVGFPNTKGGTNTIGVQVKGTSKRVENRYWTTPATFKQLANSNMPALLLVVDVKQNSVFYTWLREAKRQAQIKPSSIWFPVTRINDDEKRNLRKRVREVNTNWPPAA